METTGKYDSSGEELFVGDKVCKAWRWFPYKGDFNNMKAAYKIHTIEKHPSYKMGDGNIHEDREDIVYLLSGCSNIWKGEEVTKISKSLLSRMNFPEGTLFYTHEGEFIKYKDIDGMNEEDAKNYLQWLAEGTRRMLWGK